ncbi:hypothetical protein KBD09_03575 [Candidatus Woesebacteria bacterium]|jgi:hypothetical protein|nr:hypothetical protein [Candidatus Woesebacteria bacterium]
MSIIRKEKITKPRILFLDFDPKVVKAIAEKGYVTIQGDSGLSGKPTKIPQHPSEVELIFWDCSKLTVRPSGMGFSPDHDAIQKIQPYFTYVRSKNGITTALLSRDTIVPKHISGATGYTFGLTPRTTTNIIPPTYEEEGIEHLKPLLERFVQDENVKFSIVWADNRVGYTDFYKDEDDNRFVGFSDPDLLLFPYVNSQVDFILCALQDCFPYMTNEDIFPDIHNIVWLNSDEFIYPEVKELENEIVDIQQKAQVQVDKVEKEIKVVRGKTSFLNQALIADDSDAFNEESKLKPQVVKMFKVLGFKVTDLDEENKKLGQALKEDIQIADNGYFALVEVKGTERGAKASWIRVDLNAHITEYARIKKVESTTLCSMLVFNHERRTSPLDRTQPFASDPNLITYCAESNITLIPIYELYKLCIAVLTDKISVEDARAELKNPGLYKFTEK